MSSEARSRLSNYLRWTGWIEPEESGPAGSLWKRPKTDLLLPVPHELVQDGLDWDRIVERLAMVEGVEPGELVNRIYGLSADVANIRAANDVVIHDTIPYSAGVTMVRESWTMFRASATTSLGARSHIRRYRPSADALLENARMAHTRRGSYIIPIYLPLPEYAAPADTLPSDDFATAVPESRARRVMRTFAESLAAVAEIAIQPEAEPTPRDVQDLIRAGVSHEFTTSLRRILREDSVAEFSATFEWAAIGGPPPRTAAAVRVPAEATDRLRRVADKLRTTPAPRHQEFLTGPIVGVQRDHHDQTGVVRVQVSRNARLSHVSVNVTRDRLDECLDWMKARSTVVVQSRVHRAGSGLVAESRDAVTPLAIHQFGDD